MLYRLMLTSGISLGIINGLSKPERVEQRKEYKEYKESHSNVGWHEYKRLDRKDKL